MSKAVTSEHHTWRPGSPPPFIRPHSEAKHRVIRAYLERYVDVLTANPARDSLKLTLVDGFAGGGRYLLRNGEERSGSPLLMLEAMKAAQFKAQQKRTKPFHLDVDYYFIERDVDAYRVLLKTIGDTEFAGQVGETIQVINGDFLSQVPSIVSRLNQPRRAGRCIFVLDQFGYAEVPLQTIESILSTLRNAEVILTFAVDSLIDYLHDEETKLTQLARVGIRIPPNTVSAAKQHGDDWRRIIQNTLHDQIAKGCGAKFYTPFFIRSEDAHRDFWLIHLSGHHRARDVMVGLHWDQSTNFVHYGGAGFDMLGYDPSNDANWTKQHTLPTFEFDFAAKEASQAALLEQVPELISRYRDGISFDAFFANTTNRCPVTSEIMQKVIEDLAEDGRIRIRDSSGSKRKRRKISEKKDILCPNPQMLIPFGFSGP